ncbi:MAG: glycosyltransferase, partial [Anaerolineaceae bacterium]|nr:glycosyltransferase [Anaerolineaceae bacterium]
MDKISFVILTWNSEKVISACLDSIAEISEQDKEIIIVDNGSSDKTVEIIDQFIKANSQITIRLIQLEKNYGTTISRNLG